VHLDDPFFDEYVPIGQSVQSVFSSLPSTLTNVPIAQGTHLDLLFAPLLVP